MTDEDKVIVAYGNTFATPSGQMVLDDIRKTYGARSSFALDPYKTAFNEGQRDVLLRLDALLAKAKTLTQEAYVDGTRSRDFADQ